MCVHIYRNTYLDKSESYDKSRLLTTQSTVHIYIYMGIYIYTQTYVSFISQVWFMLHLRETPCELYHRMSWGIIAISLGYILQVLRTMLSTSKQLQKKRCCGNFWMQHTKVTKVSKAKIYPRPHILLENRHHLGLTS